MCFILIVNWYGGWSNCIIITHLKCGTQNLNKYIPLMVTVFEVKQSSVILYSKLVKLVIQMHFFSYKLSILFRTFVFGKCQNFNSESSLLSAILFLLHEMIYSLKCYVLLKNNDLDIPLQVNMSRKQMMVLSGLRKIFPSLLILENTRT